MSIWTRVLEAREAGATAADLDMCVPAEHPEYEEEVATLVDFYQAPGQKLGEAELRQLVYRTAMAVFLLADAEAETTDEDAILTIARLADALDQAGVKWTSGRN